MIFSRVSAFYKKKWTLSVCKTSKGINSYQFIFLLTPLKDIKLMYLFLTIV